MLSVSDLPAINATLNGTSALLLAAGYVAIRRGRRKNLHRALMLSALAASILFLASYLYYHYHVGTTRFPGTGWARPVYFTILTTHTILAIVIVPLIVVTLRRAFRDDFTRHRRIARITLPLWFYVSVTGIIVYLMLYQLYPSA
jgi:putative membrane protein